MPSRQLLALAAYLLPPADLARLDVPALAPQSILLTATHLDEPISPTADQTRLEALAEQTGLPAVQLERLLRLYLLSLDLHLTAAQAGLLYQAGLDSAEALSSMPAAEIRLALKTAVSANPTNLPTFEPSNLPNPATHPPIPSLAAIQRWQADLSQHVPDPSASQAQIALLQASSTARFRKNMHLTVRLLAILFAAMLALTAVLHSLRVAFGQGDWRYVEPANRLADALVRVLAVTASTAVMLLIFFIFIGLAALVAFTGLRLIDMFFLTTVAGKWLSPEQRDRYIHLEQDAAREIPEADRVQRWLIIMAGVTLAVLIGYMAVNASSLADLNVLLGRFKWLVSLIIAWIVLWVTVNQARIIAHDRRGEGSGLSPARQAGMLNYLLQAIWTTVFLVLILNLTQALYPWLNRLGDVVSLKIIAFAPQPELAAPFAQISYSQETIDTLHNVLQTGLARPVFLAILAISFIIIFLVQPWRTLIYGVVIVGGSLLLDALLARLPLAAGDGSWRWLERLVVLLIIGFFLDLLFSLVVDRLQLRPVHIAVLPKAIYRFVPLAAIVLTGLAIAALLGWIPGFSEAAPYPSARFTPPAAARQDAHGAWLVEIPPGTTPAYGDQPANRVDHAFWIDLAEVTNGQYTRCWVAGACPSRVIPANIDPTRYGASNRYANYPVAFVDLPAAQAFCRWRAARLPTEAEWQLAAQGPNPQPYPWGSEFSARDHANLCDPTCLSWWTTAGDLPYTWRDPLGRPLGDWSALWEYLVADPSQMDGYPEAAPVGMLPDGASPYGVQDMTGNVAELVAGGAVRGGSFLRPQAATDVYFRNEDCSECPWKNVGFRCARDAAP